jgi:hypothetical protein
MPSSCPSSPPKAQALLEVLDALMIAIAQQYGNDIRRLDRRDADLGDDAGGEDDDLLPF